MTDILPHPAFFHWDGVSWIFLSKVARNCDPPIPNLPCSLTWGNERYMLLHPAIGIDGVSQTFCLGRTWTMILLISASQVARIYRRESLAPGYTRYFFKLKKQNTVNNSKLRDNWKQHNSYIVCIPEEKETLKMQLRNNGPNFPKLCVCWTN
jgi:hypothetical protein